MSELRFWEFVQAKLRSEKQVGLMVVVRSEGSSPGRKGFKMVVSGDGDMLGSIGGGIMEHKLVEYIRSKLGNREPFWELRKQVHSKDVPVDQSGMICSGTQWIAIVQLDEEKMDAVGEIVSRLQANDRINFNLNYSGLGINRWDPSHTTPEDSQEAEWSYTEILGTRDIVHVIGGGHVGREMCRVMAMLNFHVVNYDDRPGLNTMQANEHADEKIVLPYPQVGDRISGGKSVYVIVMTFGYRGDDQAIRALLGKEFAYLGMMGSETKVAKLLDDLRKDGFPEEQIQAINTPAGLTLHCKTPIEIAISVAAEIIDVKNNINLRT